MTEYSQIQQKLAKSWTTYNVRTMLGHVYLPDGFSISLGIKEFRDGKFIREMLVKKDDPGMETVRPMGHAYDHSYTEIECNWRDISINVKTSIHKDNLIILITTLSNQKTSANLILETGFLWNRPGYTEKISPNEIHGVTKGKKFKVFTQNELSAYDPAIDCNTPYFSIPLSQNEIFISTGKAYSSDEIKKLLSKAQKKHVQNKNKYKKAKELYNAMQSVMAWDTIYDPLKERVISVAARTVSIGSGGYVLFCWDTYFAAYMAAIDNKELAYANILEMNSEKTPLGFVPNAAWGSGFTTRDRAEPPVGSACTLAIYNIHKEKWFLDAAFDDLYAWNSFNYHNRQVSDGLLAWGSNYYEPLFDQWWETKEGGVGGRFGAALESGLDNSPMYDNIPYDEKTHLMQLSDVGLMGMYLLDTKSLIKIAEIIGKDTNELKNRYEHIKTGLKSLWCDDFGLHLNKQMLDSKFSKRISPTNFYPMLTGELSKDTTNRMVNEHFYNSKEFWGKWILPSIAKNDPAFSDQNYWRGRIWAPMNFLVYLGLRMQGEFETASKLARKSEKLILNEWLSKNHIHENYSPFDGTGCQPRSNRFYHWGALLSLIGLMDQGFLPNFEDIFI